MISRAISFDKFDLQYSAEGGFENRAVLLWNLKFQHPEWVRYRVSVQGVESLWGDCRFIPADRGSQ